jgi:hypothetical protein
MNLTLPPHIPAFTPPGHRLRVARIISLPGPPALHPISTTGTAFALLALRACGVSDALSSP